MESSIGMQLSGRALALHMQCYAADFPSHKGRKTKEQKKLCLRRILPYASMCIICLTELNTKFNIFKKQIMTGSS